MHRIFGLVNQPSREQWIEIVRLAQLPTPSLGLTVPLLWLIGGLAITGISWYAAASSPSPIGGHYWVTWGAIGWGLFATARALFRLPSILKLRAQQREARRLVQAYRPRVPRREFDPDWAASEEASRLQSNTEKVFA
jgi:hypothetical protein